MAKGGSGKWVPNKSMPPKNVCGSNDIGIYVFSCFCSGFSNKGAYKLQLHPPKETTKCPSESLKSRVNLSLSFPWGPVVPSPALIHGVFVHRLLLRAPWHENQSCSFLFRSSCSHRGWVVSCQKKCDDMYGDELNSTNHLFILKYINPEMWNFVPHKQMTVNSIKRGSLFSFKKSAVCAPKKICVLRPPRDFPQNSAQRHGRCDRSCRSRLPPASVRSSQLGYVVKLPWWS